MPAVQFWQSGKTISVGFNKMHSFLSFNIQKN